MKYVLENLLVVPDIILRRNQFLLACGSAWKLLKALLETYLCRRGTERSEDSPVRIFFRLSFLSHLIICVRFCI